MDRDDHALSLTTAATPCYSSSAVPFDEAFDHLPGDVKREVIVLGKLMEEIHKARFVREACDKIAQRMHGVRGRSAETLRKHYQMWRIKAYGAAALIDHRKCGTLANEGACGVIGCTAPRSRRGLSQELIETFWAKCATNDKQGIREGWERMITLLCSGQPVVEGITWQTLHIKLFPGLPLPPRCPWSLSHPPPGWSQSNFTRHRMAKAVFDAIQKGGAAAWLQTPDVRMDLSELRFLEAVVFDDHRLDFEVMVWDDQGKVQIVELWGLFAMDVATGALIDFGLRPKLQRKDGSTEGLTMRDMQHLIAHILATYGYPTAYKMQLIVENAAAAVSTHTEQLLLTRSHGQVVVRRTGVHCGDFIVRGFPERWGGPRGKAWLESVFHPLDIALGDVKGQMGSNYTRKPGDHDGRVRIAERLAAVMTAFPEMAGKLSTPLHWSGDAHRLISEAIQALNDRTDHKMTRHRQIVEWRWSEGDTNPKPMQASPDLPAHIQREIEAFTAMPAEARATLINNYGCTRMESPAEKVRRLYRPQDFAAIPSDTYLDLMMDTAPALYKGGDVLDVEIKRGKQKQTIRFAGSCTALAAGEMVKVRFNSDRPSAGAWVHDERETFLAYLQFMRDPRMLVDEDLPLLQQSLGAKTKAHHNNLSEARRIISRLPEHANQLEQVDRDIAAMATLNLPKPATVAAALPESADLARVVMSTKRTKAKAPVSDADAYLRMQQAMAAERED